VLRELVRRKTQGACPTWSLAPRDVRESVAPLVGKDADGRPLQGHQHAEFFVWYEHGVPTRLLVWRAYPFDGDEERALLAGADRELSWAVGAPGAGAWRLKLLPLDRGAPPPPGFDGKPARVWESVTPYVPPRHYIRKGKVRDLEAIPQQVRRELTSRGLPGEAVDVEEIADPTWVAVHIPPKGKRRGRCLGERRGYWLRLCFPEAVAGPLRIGHSSSFGLGLFRPIFGL